MTSGWMPRARASRYIHWPRKRSHAITCAQIAPAPPPSVISCWKPARSGWSTAAHNGGNTGTASAR